MSQVNNILLRILATFAASGLGVIGAGTIAGVPVMKAVLMAGIGGVVSKALEASVVMLQSILQC